MVVFGQKWLYSTDGCVRKKVVVFGQNLFFSAKYLYSGKTYYIRAKCYFSRKKWLYSGKSGCVRVKVLYLCKVVVFGQSGCIRAELVVFG